MNALIVDGGSNTIRGREVSQLGLFKLFRTEIWQPSTFVNTGQQTDILESPQVLFQLTKSKKHYKNKFYNM